MTLKEEIVKQVEKRIPRHLPVEQLRQWLIDQIFSIDKDRKNIANRLKTAPKNKAGRLVNDGDVRAKTKKHYLLMERVYLRDVLGKINQQIKERNLAMHSLNKNEVQIFIEMAKLLEEKYPDIYDETRDTAEINLNIRKRRTKSNYVKMIKKEQ
jgi:hypothetical protein